MLVLLFCQRFVGVGESIIYSSDLEKTVFGRFGGCEKTNVEGTTGKIHPCHRLVGVLQRRRWIDKNNERLVVQLSTVRRIRDQKRTSLSSFLSLPVLVAVTTKSANSYSFLLPRVGGDVARSGVHQAPKFQYCASFCVP